ncbi:MAG: hypothetical protein ACJ72H_00105 [Candidatus Sulfotelmatobacter sp.]
MSHWTAVAYWVGINIVVGVFGPLIIGIMFVRYTVPKPRITLKQFYAKGELGFAGLLIVLSMIVDIRKSHYASGTIQTIVLGLSLVASASAYTWAVPLCNDVVHAGTDWSKVWRDSWRMALMVFCVGLVTEIMLEMP